MPGIDYQDNGHDNHRRDARRNHHAYHNGHPVQAPYHDFCVSDLQNQIDFSGIPHIAPIITVREYALTGLLKNQMVQYAPKETEMNKTIYVRQHVTTANGYCLLPVQGVFGVIGVWEGEKQVRGKQYENPDSLAWILKKIDMRSLYQ